MPNADFRSGAIQGRDNDLADLMFGANPLSESNLQAAAASDPLSEQVILTIHRQPPADKFTTGERWRLNRRAGVAGRVQRGRWTAAAVAAALARFTDDRKGQPRLLSTQILNAGIPDAERCHIHIQ